MLETCSVSKEMASFLKVLLRRRHMDWLGPIFEAVHVLVDNEHNRATAFVKVAIKLSEVQREKLKNKLENLTQKKIDLRVEFDPSVIGGIVAQIGDRIFDTSLKNRLNLIKDGMER